MARPLRIEYPGAFYHIIQRGNERRDIFLSQEDMDRFYAYLKVLHERYAIAIHTYCLMNNHYHLILETPQANLSKAMHFLNTSYTVYFNTKRKRSGHLFQGRYKALLVQADEYLHHLSRYIHINPVRANVVKDPAEYHHSSYRYFIHNDALPDWLDTTFILEMFDKNMKKAKSLYKKFVIEGMGSEKETIQKNTVAGFLLGNEEFVEEIKGKFIKHKSDKEIPVLNKLKDQLNPKQIQTAVEKRVPNQRLSRNISIYLIKKHTQISLKDIAARFSNITDAGVSALYYRLDRKIGKDKGLKSSIDDIERMLKIET